MLASIPYLSTRPRLRYSVRSVSGSNAEARRSLNIVYHRPNLRLHLAGAIADADVEIVGGFGIGSADGVAREEERVVEVVGARNLNALRIVREHAKSSVASKVRPTFGGNLSYLRALLRTLDRSGDAAWRMVTRLRGSVGVLPKHSTKPVTLDVAQLLVRSRVNT